MIYWVLKYKKLSKYQIRNFGEYVTLSGYPMMFRDRYHAVHHRNYRMKETSKNIISVKIRLVEVNKDGILIIPNNEFADVDILDT